MRRVATAWEVIEGVLKENAHSAYQALRPPAKLAEIRAFEALIGVRLPQSLVSSLRIHDGMNEGTTFADYNRLHSVAEITRWWRLLMDCPWQEPGPRLRNARRIKGDLRWRPHWVPFGGDGNGNLLGVDLDPGPAGSSSQVFPFENYGEPPPHVVASSYRAWLDAVAEELQARRFTLDEYGKIHFRRRLT